MPKANADSESFFDYTSGVRWNYALLLKITSNKLKFILTYFFVSRDCRMERSITNLNFEIKFTNLLFIEDPRAFKAALFFDLTLASICL